jgi:hypothetical protein
MNISWTWTREADRLRYADGSVHIHPAVVKVDFSEATFAEFDRIVLLLGAENLEEAEMKNDFHKGFFYIPSSEHLRAMNIVQLLVIAGVAKKQ